MNVEKGGKKNDTNKKYRPELLPLRALMEVIKVFTDGAKKYGDFNWEKGIAYSRLYGATLRHLLDYGQGKDIDEDSGSPALAHAIANLMMLLEMSSQFDDRTTHGMVGDSVGQLGDGQFADTETVKIELLISGE